jgi:hypothetical protein
LSGVGVVDGNGGAAFFGEGTGLVYEFLGKIKGGEVPVAEVPEPERHPTGATAGFEKMRSRVRE